MLLSLLILALVTAGGTALTYLYEKEESLLARLCMGHVVGMALFGTAGFVLALIGRDLTSVNSAIALAIATAPAAMFKWDRFRTLLRRDWKQAESATQGFSRAKLLRFSYYLFFLILFLFYFDRAMIVRGDAIFTGASQNYGDLPAHLGAIYAFTDGGVFPPENPSYAFAKFTYPFLVDFITAMTMQLGAGVREAMYIENTSLSFCLLVLLERFAARLTGSATIGKVSSALFFFSGGLGFVSFFSNMLGSNHHFWDYIWKIEQDYTIGKNYRWGNPMVVLLITQRSFLLGMPLTLMALSRVWAIFKAKTDDVARGFDWKTLSVPFIAGVVTGSLPLIHVHSLVAVFIVCACLFFFNVSTKWMQWAAFAVGVSIIAVPELLWIMTGSASNFMKFVEWQKGWEYTGGGIVMFWLRNTGILLPALAVSLVAAYLAARKPKGDSSEDTRVRIGFDLLVFYAPFALIFIITNFVKLAPWGWDNIKVMIYWFIASLPFIAYLLVSAWKKDAVYKSLAASAFIVLCLSGAIDVWRVASHQIEFNLFDKDGVAIGNDIRLRTPPDALFLNAPIHNPPTLLAGRRSLMRSPGHLFSYGIDATERDNDTKEIYAGGPQAITLLAKYRIDYVMLGPQERMMKNVNEIFFQRFPVIAERGTYKVYKIR